MKCPSCNSSMVMIERDITYQCVYSQCPNTNKYYYPLSSVGHKDDKTLVRCPDCHKIAEVMDDDGNTVLLDCSLCGIYYQTRWSDEQV